MSESTQEAIYREATAHGWQHSLVSRGFHRYVRQEYELSVIMTRSDAVQTARLNLHTPDRFRTVASVDTRTAGKRDRIIAWLRDPDVARARALLADAEPNYPTFGVGQP